MNKKLSIVIPVFNKFNFTKTCLKDLSHLPNDHEIIIFDNGSSDETKFQLHNSKEIRYIRSEVNLGFAAASNRGYAYSASPNVLFLNNDIKVRINHSNWTDEIIKLCPDGLVGPTMGLLDNNLNFVKEANEVLAGNSYMSGWCVGSSKEIWNKLLINNYVGPFSEEFGIAYHEDTDMGFRAKKMGIKFIIINLPGLVHFGKMTSSQLNVHKLYTESKHIFINKWGSDKK